MTRSHLPAAPPAPASLAPPTIDEALATYAAAGAAVGPEGLRLARLAAEQLAAAGADAADSANAHVLAAEHAAGHGLVADAVGESGLAVARLEGQPGGVRADQRPIWGEALRAHGSALRDDGQHGPALETLTRALGTVRADPDRPPLLELLCLNDLGMLAKFSGRYDDAMAAYTEAEALVATLPEPGPWQATLDHNIGGVLHNLGQPEAARARTRRAVIAVQERDPVDPGALARELGALGAIEINCDAAEDAVAHLGEAIDLYTAAGHAEHPDAAAAWSNLGRAHFTLGALEPAAEAYERALTLRRAFCRLGHPDIVFTLNNYAALLIDLEGDLDRATELLGEAASNATHLADDHPLHEVIAHNQVRLLLGDWTHEDHLRVCLLLLDQLGDPAAVVERLRVLITAYHQGSAAGPGQGGFHHTVTEYYVRSIDALRPTTVPELVAHPTCSRTALHEHWSKPLLASPEARTGWVAPDLLPLLASRRP